jgi:hypothetical protein
MSIPKTKTDPDRKPTFEHKTDPNPNEVKKSIPQGSSCCPLIFKILDQKDYTSMLLNNQLTYYPMCGDRKAYYRNATSRHIDLQPLPKELVRSVCNGPLSSIVTSAADQIT